ncbi:MAG: PA2169 family four-helix-bundle protein [Sphingomonas sp.]
MSDNTDVSKLDDLIVTTIDSIKGYEHSAEHADAERYAEMFKRLAAARREVVLTLQDQSRALGGTPSDFGSASATLHRRFEDLRRVLGGGDEVIVKEIERGEDYLKEEFERAMRDENISAATRSIIDGCFVTVKRGHDEISQLKHQLAAAS